MTRSKRADAFKKLLGYRVNSKLDQNLLLGMFRDPLKGSKKSPLKRDEEDRSRTVEQTYSTLVPDRNVDEVMTRIQPRHPLYVDTNDLKS